MKIYDNRLLWGALLVCGGILFLLQNFGLFQFDNLIWAFLMGCAGVIFLGVLVSNRQNWWAVIPGLVLSYLALLVALDQWFPAFTNDFGGAIFLGVIGLSFLIIYLLQPTFWWAIIPCGALFTLGIVAASNRFVSGIDEGGILFMGIGVTFAVLSLVNTPTGKMRWPLIPAGILILMGGLISFAATSAIRLIWPIALIAFGLYLFFMQSPRKQP